ncbi:hypothetical protein [Priestia megaterium]|uniref:hypothetical protein n=1 Tax=Priestia megaterium TaxID=1404 RepID=UPI003CC5C3EE
MAIIEGQMVKVKWNNANRRRYESLGYTFTENGLELEVKVEHLSKHAHAFVNFKCDWCGDSFTRDYKVAVRHNHHYCKHSCSTKHLSAIKISKRIKKLCETCNEEYAVPNNLKDSSRFCSKQCLQDWQKINFKEDKSSVYVERVEVNCGWCNERIKRTKSYLSNRINVFCSKSCKDTYHKEVFLKEEETIERNRKIMLTNLTENKISFTDSKPQRILNKTLDMMGVTYENEKIIHYYAFDNYITDYDVYIEVNGGYWHCDPRFYPKILHDVQVNRIISDKKKRTHLRNNLGKQILYLWEFDIENNIKLCDKLINYYIENKGSIPQYDSFNYYLDNFGNLKIKSDLIIPYIDYDYSSLEKIIIKETRERVSRKDPDKHITFNCEVCGKEKTQPKKVYEKAKNHYCSVKCSNNKSPRKTVSCSFCKKDIIVKNYVYRNIISGKQKNCFCNNECKNEFQRLKHKNKNHTK